MGNSDFHALQEDRKEWIESTRKNNFDLDSILTELYSDPSHFIFEILQNAEDAGAKLVNFRLFNDRLEIVHNGRDFNFKDVEGITGIGKSYKKDDLTAIGKFGIGFKSVFSITDTPEIHSGDYHFKIVDLVVPEKIDTNDEYKRDTTIILRFNHSKRDAEEVRKIIHEKLKNLEAKTFLFLYNIEEVQWETSDEKGHFRKEKKVVNNNENLLKVTIITEESSIQYLILKIPYIETREIDRYIEVAYKISGKKITKEKDAKLSVFFPTERDTYLNFLIQGPFKTTPTRENIPIDGENQEILHAISDLVAESLTILKQAGYLNVDYLNILPLDSYLTNDPIYKMIYEKIREKLNNEELIPTMNGGFVKAKDAVLAGSSELTKLLDERDLIELFDKRKWISDEITYDRTRDLWKYLSNNLNIEEIEPDKFARKVNSDFFKNKTDKWMASLYSFLIEQKSLWRKVSRTKKTGYYSNRDPDGSLLNKPFIRLSDGKHVKPFAEDGLPNAYLPPEGETNFPIVKREIIANEKALEFLKKLGISEPDVVAEVIEYIIPKYKDDIQVSKDDNLKDMEKIHRAFSTDSQ